MPQIKCKAWSCRGGVVVGPYDQERVCKECNGTGYVEGEEKKAEFQPAFDMPATREQALECLKKWGDPLCATFNAERAKRMWELLKEPTPEAMRKLIEKVDRLVEMDDAPPMSLGDWIDAWNEMKAAMDAVRGKA